MNMNMAVYYQVYGFNAWLPTQTYFARRANELAARIFTIPCLRARHPPDAVELILGILPNGASYLYVDRDQAIALSGRRDLRGGVSADAFESLSPALFSSQIELAEKLRKYEQKASKKKTLVRDTSVLNRDFTWDSGRSPVGVARASFELQRLLYHVWCHPQSFQFARFGLDPTVWRGRSTRIYSLFFSTWDKTRLAQDHPKALELGLVELRVSESGNVRPDKTTYIALKTGLSNEGNPALLKDAASGSEKEVLPQARFSERIHEVVASAASSGATYTATVFLVYNTRASSAILADFGFNTHGWEKGVNSLLAPAQAPSTLSWSERSQSSSRDPRSRSPRRGPNSDLRQRDYSSPLSASSKSSRPDVAPRLPSIHMVDVADMCGRLLRDDTIDPSYAFDKEMKSQAKALGLEPEDGWCAGNECDLLARMWLTMVRGNAIDDQYEQRRSVSREMIVKEESTAAAVPAVQVEDEEDDEEDYDPNTISAVSVRQPVELASDESDAEDVY